MSSFDFESYFEKAEDEFARKQAQLKAVFGIGSYERFVVDYDANSLDFFQYEALKAHASIVPIATHVPEQTSLKWAWANDQYSDQVRKEASRMKEMSALTGFDFFLSEYVDCEESMAWNITTLACKFLNAQGAYRVPHGHINCYVLITSVTSAA